jgi:hypothetical protein
LLEGDEFVASIREGLINPAAYLNALKLVAFVTGTLKEFLSSASSKECDIRELVRKGNNVAS